MSKKTTTTRTPAASPAGTGAAKAGAPSAHKATKGTKAAPATTGLAPARTAVAAAKGGTSGVRGASAEFRHPLLDQARAQVAQGATREAGDTLVALAGQVGPHEKVQVLALAAQFLKAVDNPRAVTLATQAAELGPDSAQAWMALAAAHDEARRRKETVAAARRAVQAKASPRELVDAGRLLSRLGEDALALEAVRKGYDGSGGDIRLASYTLRVALQCADWELSERITAQLQQAHDQGRTEEAGETPRTHVLWCADEVTNIKVISNFAAKAYPAREPLVKAPWPHDGKRKLRVGYLSSDYRDHATSLLALGMMRHHDRSRFELYAYCTSYDDGSALRRDMLNRCDKARTIAKLTDRQAAELIMRDRIDVLVDLNGLTEGTRHGVMAWHPAPVQMAYLGYPGTVGGRFVEYVIGDDYTVPAGAEQLYPEKIIRIPPTYQINDYLARYLPPAPGRAALGLPVDRPVIGMFNNVNKVSREVWQTWMRVLQQVPQAVLWMLDPGVEAAGHLRTAAQAAGVDTERLIFAPKMRQEQHIARLRQCDLVLDPWPYGGHTTTGDALFAGAPVVALEGSNFASRVSGGLLRAAGLPQLVRPDVDAYVATAVQLLQRPQELLQLKRYLLQSRARLPVFDAPGRTRQLEAGYAAAYQRALKGQAPDHLTVRVNVKPAKAPATGATSSATTPSPTPARSRAAAPAPAGLSVPTSA